MTSQPRSPVWCSAALRRLCRKPLDVGADLVRLKSYVGQCRTADLWEAFATLGAEDLALARAIEPQLRLWPGFGRPSRIDPGGVFLTCRGGACGIRTREAVNPIRSPTMHSDGRATFAHDSYAGMTIWRPSTNTHERSRMRLRLRLKTHALAGRFVSDAVAYDGLKRHRRRAGLT